MKTLRRTLGTALVGVMALSLVGAEPVSADTGSDEITFANKLNELRASRGLPALAFKGELFDLARSWSRTVAGVGTISHNPNLAAQAPANWARMGENVGVGPDVPGLHDAFVASPTHLRNMIDAGYDSVGVGVVYANGLIFVTVNFMTTKAAPASAPAPQGLKGAVCKKARKGKVVCKAAGKARRASAARRRR